MPQTALLCGFWNISKLCKMRGGIFDSRTGHHQHLLTFGLTKPIVSFLFCSEKAVVRCLSATVKILLQSAFFCTLLFFFSENQNRLRHSQRLHPKRKRRTNLYRQRFSKALLQENDSTYVISIAILFNLVNIYDEIFK